MQHGRPLARPLDAVSDAPAWGAHPASDTGPEPQRIALSSSERPVDDRVPRRVGARSRRSTAMRTLSHNPGFPNRHAGPDGIAGRAVDRRSGSCQPRFPGGRTRVGSPAEPSQPALHRTGARRQPERLGVLRQPAGTAGAARGPGRFSFPESAHLATVPREIPGNRCN